ncbi:MAG TPA: hypothetical protein GXZ26_00085 [Firmicutes bacterium]|jgi:hypothetical protein|nr:hypothetical protein [Bacillota bacterium]
MNINWIRLVIRAAATFIVLFLLGYIVPGFSGLTLGRLAAVSLLVAVISSLVEMAVRPGSPRDRSIILFLVTAVVVYLYSLAMINVRPPVVSTLLAAAIVAGVDLVYPEKRPLAEGEREEGMHNP